MTKIINSDEEITKIINWKTEEVIIEGKLISFKHLVERAVDDGISLAYADLQNAYLDDAYLCDADLRGANFERAYLNDVDLTGADFTGANFEGAYLRGIKINQDQIDDLLKALGVKII